MTRPNPHIALIYHYDLARALAGEVVDWQAIPVNVDAGREGGDLCRQAADFAKRRDLFAMPAPSVEPLPAFSDTEKEAPALPPGITREQYGPTLQPGDAWDLPNPSAVPVGPNPAVEQQAADPEPSTASTTVPGPAVDENGEPCSDTTSIESGSATVPSFALSTSTTPVPTTTAPVSTSASSSRDRLRARMAELVDFFEDAEHALRRYWPEGVPTLKHDGHTDAQLQLILACVRRVETEVGAGWHPDDGPPPHVNTNPRASVDYPVPPQIDEGGRLDPATLAAMQAEFAGLGVRARELCAQIAEEANDAGRPLSVSLNPTVRRWSIARAVIAWAALPRDELWPQRTLDRMWFTASNLATHEQCRDPSATLGGLISQFTIEQADRLYQAAGQ